MQGGHGVATDSCLIPPTAIPPSSSPTLITPTRSLSDAEARSSLMSYNKDCRAGYLQYLNFNSEDAQMPRFCDMPAVPAAQPLLSQRTKSHLPSRYQLDKFARPLTQALSLLYITSLKHAIFTHRPHRFSSPPSVFVFPLCPSAPWI